MVKNNDTNMLAHRIKVLEAEKSRLLKEPTYSVFTIRSQLKERYQTFQSKM